VHSEEGSDDKNMVDSIADLQPDEMSSLVSSFTDECLDSVVESVRRRVLEYVAGDLKADILKHNLSGSTFVYEESYRRWLAPELSRIVGSLIMTHAIEYTKEELASEIQQRLDSLREEASLSDSVLNGVCTLPRGPELVRRDLMHFDASDGADTGAGALIVLYGIIFLPVTVVAAPVVGLGASLLAGVGVAGSFGVAAASLIFGPMLHIGLTAGAVGSVFAFTEAEIMVTGGEEHARYWMWYSSEIVERAISQTVDNLLNNPEQWYPRLQSQLDTLLAQCTAELENKVMQQSQLIRSTLLESDEAGHV